jgi:3-deoxy-D-manno-octulosonic-acid transferase
MIWLYRAMFLPALFCALPYYGWRMWRRGGYRRDFAHRFGYLRNVPPRRMGVKRIWIQAVSVGELLALQPLLRALADDQTVEVVLTTTTSTGRKVLEERYADTTVWRGIFPLDFWLCSRAAWKQLKPDLVVLMESELWPEHLHQAHRRKIPVLLANARMSDRSAKRYRRWGRLVRPLLRGLSSILAANPRDQRRFESLGLEAEVELAGNLKFDFEAAPVLSPAQRAAERDALGLGNEDVLLVGASTWPGEERLLAQLVSQFRAEGMPVRALIVPRHAERKAELVRELADIPLATHFRSDGSAPGHPVDLYIGDTTGELRRFVQLGDVLFIGKSMPPHQGGQTPIEAAAYKKSIVFGPDMSNFNMITRELLLAGGATEASHSTLEAALRARLSDPGRREQEGAAAGAVIAQHRGATGRVVAALQLRLRACGPSSGRTY